MQPWPSSAPRRWVPPRPAGRTRSRRRRRRRTSPHAIPVAQNAGSKDGRGQRHRRQAADEDGGARRTVQAALHGGEVGGQHHEIAQDHGATQCRGDDRHRRCRPGDLCFAARSGGAPYRPHEALVFACATGLPRRGGEFRNVDSQRTARARPPVHFIVVLAPLTALLAILCAIWSSVRERLVWLVLALSVFVAVLTPITTEAGGMVGAQGRQVATAAHPLAPRRHDDLFRAGIGGGCIAARGDARSAASGHATDTGRPDGRRRLRVDLVSRDDGAGLSDRRLGARVSWGEL